MPETHNGSDGPVARTFPDEYLGRGAASSGSVLEWVTRRWRGRSEGERRQLAQILVMVLEPLNEPGATITEDLRSTCEQVVTQWVEQTTPSDEREPAANPAAPEKSNRVRLIEAKGAPTSGSEWGAHVTLQVGARRHAGVERGGLDPLSQISCAARATLSALRQAVPGAPGLELKKVEVFEAFESVGVIVAVRVTEGDQESTLVGMCPNAGNDMMRAAAAAVLERHQPPPRHRLRLKARVRTPRAPRRPAASSGGYPRYSAATALSPGTTERAGPVTGTSRTPCRLP